MSSSAINQGVLSAKISNVQNVGDSSAVCSTTGDWSFKNATATATNVFISNAGNVGVGTTSPRGLLEASTASETNVGVFGRSGLAQQTIQTDSTINLLGGQADGNGPSIVFNHLNVSNGVSTGKGARIVGFRNNAGTDRAMGIDFKYADGNGTTQQGMRIDASGNVGIGATSVSSKIDVQKDSAATNPSSDQTFPAWTSGAVLKNASATDGAYAGLSFLTSNLAGTTQGFSIVGQSTASGFSSNLLFMARTASGTTTERGRIDSAGVWTFGSTSGTTDNRRHTFSGYTLTTDIDILTVENRATSTTADATYAIRCVKGSGTNTTAQRFIAFTNTAGGIGNGQINGNGSGAAAFGSYSDRRLKENIVPLAGELSKVLILNPVEFDYKDGSGHQIGFIAQEIEKVYPDAVSVLGETEEMKTVTGWDKTTARLVKAIQELSAKVDAQAAEIEALKAK